MSDVILGIPKNGPILNGLKRRISCNYALKDDSDFAKRKLAFTRTPEMFTTLASVIAQVHQLGFPSIGKAEFLNYLKGVLFNEPVTDGTMFCSQLAAHSYKAWDLLGADKVDNAYAPRTFRPASTPADSCKRQHWARKS